MRKLEELIYEQLWTESEKTLDFNRLSRPRKLSKIFFRKS